MSTTVWTLIPNQYERDIYLVLSDESFYDVVTLLNNNYGFGWKDGVDFTKDDKLSAPCTIANDETFKIVIILDKFDGSVKCYSNIAHELYHVMTHISNSVNAEMNDLTTEHWAYFLSFYMDICGQVLNEHLKTTLNTNKMSK